MTREEVTAERRDAALMSFLQLLFGVSTKESNRYESLIVSDGSKDISEVDDQIHDNGAHALLVAPQKPKDWEGDFLVFDGGMGQEGDQTIIGGSLVIETVSYGVLPYLQVSGPTYVMIEKDEDWARFLKDSQKFSLTGQLPTYLTTPGIIMDVGTVLGCCASCAKRFFVRDGVTTTTLAGDDSMVSRYSDDVRVRAFAAAIFLVQASVSNSRIVFSPQSVDADDAELLLAYDEANGRGIAMNVDSGCLFSLSADSFLVLDAFRRGQDAKIAASHKFNIGVDEIERARDYVLQRMGIDD
ncbi:MAG: hypothetical protein PUF97_01995 [Bifidobacteriaceae bacterium]|nr:hypothetical protein [Bifidobacteriaceae bacterium]